MDEDARELESLYAAGVEAVSREIRDEEPTWSPEAIRRIVQDCIDADERQCDEWYQYAKSRHLTIAINGDGAFVPLESYKSLEQDRDDFRSYARYLAFTLAMSVIAFAVLWGGR